MMDREGHKAIARVRSLLIFWTRIRLTPQVGRPPPGWAGGRSNDCNRAWFGANRSMRDPYAIVIAR
jgi:hypothetical protein